MQTSLDNHSLGSCLRQLDICLSDAGANAILQAELTIDAYAGHESDLNARTGHLHVLQSELEKKWTGLTGNRADFSYTVLEFIDNRMRELRET
jgi:hypothetical protein